MITPTENPLVLRLRLTNFLINPTTRANVICYLEISPQGLLVGYSHHEFFKRPVDKGSWTPAGVYPVPLSPALVDLINCTAMTEFWTFFCPGQLAVQTTSNGWQGTGATGAAGDSAAAATGGAKLLTAPPTAPSRPRAIKRTGATGTCQDFEHWDPRPFLAALVQTRISPVQVAEPVYGPDTSHQQAVYYLRNFCGYSESELAELIGLSASRLSEIENHPGQRLSGSVLAALVRLALDYHRPRTAEYFRQQSVLAQERVAERGGRR